MHGVQINISNYFKNLKINPKYLTEMEADDTIIGRFDTIL
jgi:hypothetical protein